MLIVEQVTGRPMRDVYDQLLLGPLGLRHTWMSGEESLEPTGDRKRLGDQPVDRPLAAVV